MWTQKCSAFRKASTLRDERLSDQRIKGGSIETELKGVTLFSAGGDDGHTRDEEAESVPKRATVKFHICPSRLHCWRGKVEIPPSLQVDLGLEYN